MSEPPRLGSDVNRNSRHSALFFSYTCMDVQILFDGDTRWYFGCVQASFV